MCASCLCFVEHLLRFFWFLKSVGMTLVHIGTYLALKCLGMTLKVPTKGSMVCHEGCKNSLFVTPPECHADVTLREKFSLRHRVNMNHSISKLIPESRCGGVPATRSQVLIWSRCFYVKLDLVKESN